VNGRSWRRTPTPPRKPRIELRWTEVGLGMAPRRCALANVTDAPATIHAMITHRNMRVEVALSAIENLKSFYSLRRQAGAKQA
jgi:hypothetical protein